MADAHDAASVTSGAVAAELLHAPSSAATTTYRGRSSSAIRLDDDFRAQVEEKSV